MSLNIPIKNKYLSFFVNKVLPTVLTVVVLVSLYKWWILRDTVKVADMGNVVVYADKNMRGMDSLAVVAAFGQADSMLLAKGCDLTDEVTIIIVKDRHSFRKRTAHLNSLALGVSLWPFSTIMLMPPDFKTMKQPATEDGFIDRPAASVWAHELCHFWQRESRGWLTGLYDNWFNKWKSEGFADYVAGSSSFHVGQGKKIFIENAEEHDNLTTDEGIWGNTYFYFLSRLRTEYLMNEKGLSQQEFWNVDYDEEELAVLDNEIRSALANGTFDIEQVR